MNVHFYSRPGIQMKGFCCWCQPQDFHCVHLSGQSIREELGGNTDEVLWLSHPGVRCQTWHGSFPNYYNMLNLLSCPHGCKFSRETWPTFLLHALNSEKKKKFFKPPWRETWNSNSLFSRRLAARAALTMQPKASSFKAARMKGCTHERLRKKQWRKVRGRYHINNQQATLHLPTAKVKSNTNTNTAAMEISD